ncbi:ferrous iron transport protein B [Candidatus Micrarchaeota archaeon]|nr:ferrous iron transport protein B [Candidatus Micrarchaeota archaeon]
MRIALAGNANVGKSVLFNNLTGLSRHVGNWPGKTIEKAEGKLNFKGMGISVVDLPGIYSLSTFSIEEQISRDYIAKEKPDVVINVVDASVLERNLFFTLQIMELGRPMVIALNMMDLAGEKGMDIDVKKLSLRLGVPVIPIIATKGKGIAELIETAIRTKKKPPDIKFRKNIEQEIKKLAEAIKSTDYPPRWVAIKLLEEDDIAVASDIKKKASLSLKKIEKCGQRGHIAISSERYAAAERISRECISLHKTGIPFTQRLDAILLHRFFGYFFLLFIAGISFLSIFAFGDIASSYMISYLEYLNQSAGVLIENNMISAIFIGGILEGIVAGVSIALPYLIPFYIILAILEDSGYLARMAFLMDSVMQKIGMHGKAFIPMLLAYGCNVPACLSCRILETQRDRLLATFAVTLVPCAAVTVVVMGLVARYAGLEWALSLYALNLLVILVLGKLAFKAFPGEYIGLVMEMPSYKVPALGNIVFGSWKKIRSFVMVAFPVIIASTILIKAVELLGLLEDIAEILSPVTVGWLGLPAIVGLTLVFGVLRKELTIIMLAALLGTAEFDTVLTNVQMITIAVVTMFYVPCMPTIAVLKKEQGWKVALAISLFEIVFAIILAGLIARILTYPGISLPL